MKECEKRNESADSFRHVAPLGFPDSRMRWEGCAAKKPWQYRTSVCIPHLDTLEPLQVVIDLLRLQTEKPYILVIDTGSPWATVEKLEAMRAEDLEISYLRAHGYIQSSGPVSTAMDFAMALTRTPYLFCTHTDVFLKKRDWLKTLADQCGPDCPVVGYEMSPRGWVTDLWKGMCGHTTTMLHMPTIRNLGACWNMEHTYELCGWKGQNAAGWPDTEVGFFLHLRKHGIMPKLIGHEQNFTFQRDENLDHARSYTGGRAYDTTMFRRAEEWMKVALADARARISEWRGEATQPCQCPAAGWCPRYQREQRGRLFELCQTREDYRELWDKQIKEQSRSAGLH